jgi:aspartate racemase
MPGLSTIEIHSGSAPVPLTEQAGATGVTGSRNPLVGVLGGMGPAATLDFLAKILAATPAAQDQDHIPVAVWSDPRIPNRNLAILEPERHPSPAPDLQAGARRLEGLGADFIAIACNTAHHWHDDIQGAVAIPVLHIADIAVARLAATGHRPGTRVGLMCSDGTLGSGYYDRRLQAAGYPVLRPTTDMQRRMMEAIYAVKVDAMALAARLSRELAREFLALGAEVLLVACTELPLALGPDMHALPCLDATVCLAEACVARALAV